MDYKLIHEELLEYKKKGIKDKEIAKMAGVERSHASRYRNEWEDRLPAMSLAAFLGIFPWADELIMNELKKRKAEREGTAHNLHQSIQNSGDDVAIQSPGASVYNGVGLPVDYERRLLECVEMCDKCKVCALRLLHQ